MSRIGILGAGAFGTALAVALARGGRKVNLVGRDATLARDRASPRLPGVRLHAGITLGTEPALLGACEAVLLTVPMQTLAEAVTRHRKAFGQAPLVACCKGVDLGTLLGPTAVIAGAAPDAIRAVLTGPSFAADIAQGLPTALTLACEDPAAGETLQHLLSVPTLRLYRTTDTTGAELGGAIKNVVAIAAGAAIGAGLGDSARAALMTRGYAEMSRLALVLGARPETLAGLSGLGDLVLTCTSGQSRNFRYGHAMGRGEAFGDGVTVEGIATAIAVARLARERGIEMPITETVAALAEGRLTIGGAMDALLARPLKEE
jgi:glycerol-3-phosphate dehydrogenase (NAD(P)+)